jgi:hypothetical protein
MKNLIKLTTLFVAAGFFLASCEGPMGPAGKDGTNGTNGAAGTDANETCKECHNPEMVDAVAVEFEMSKHNTGIVAEEEAGNVGCTPCHTSQAFRYVCENNIPSTFLQGTNGKYTNQYASIPTATLGAIDCFTCHNKLHTDGYTGAQMTMLTNTAAVSMTMWAGTKSINLTQDGAMGNLCVKCHQPRPLAKSSSISDGNVVNYDSLKNFPALVFYNSAVGNAAPNKVVPSYRTHIHYGAVGAVFAGVGGIEFPGTLDYTSSPHATAAACQNCHMATLNGVSGGHTFWAKGNFNGCNVAGCHDANPVSATSSLFTNTRTATKALLDQLAAKINTIGGATPILHSEPDATANLWAGLTTGNWDGYLNIYDPSSNPAGVWKNPGSTSSWTQPQKDINNALPTFPSLTNGQMGALINFQLCLREFSLGIHNTKYSAALLTNSIAII